jgi:hypothetical protein
MGLDKGRYWQPFNSWEEILEYVASCRFHDPARWKSRSHDEDDKETEEDQARGTESKPLLKLLKANDRQRAGRRPLFGYWIETYLPAHVDDKAGRSALLTREEVVDDAKQFFGPEFAQKFEDRKRKMTRVIGTDKLWADIRKGLPIEGTEVGWVMKGMKREIVGKHRDAPLSEAAEGLEDVRKAFEESRFDDVLEWARVNWREVGERQKKLDQQQKQNTSLGQNQEGGERKGVSQ